MSRYVLQPYRRRGLRLAATLAAAATLLVIAYIVICTPLDKLAETPPGTVVICLGRAAETASVEGRQIYRLADLNSEVYVISEHGEPATGACLFVWGQVERTSENRPIIVEFRRRGTF